MTTYFAHAAAKTRWARVFFPLRWEIPGKTLFFPPRFFPGLNRLPGKTCEPWMGAATCAHPSFGMTTTKTLRSVFSWHTSYYLVCPGLSKTAAPTGHARHFVCQTGSKCHSARPNVRLAFSYMWLINQAGRLAEILCCQSECSTHDTEFLTALSVCPTFCMDFKIYFDSPTHVFNIHGTLICPPLNNQVNF